MNVSNPTNRYILPPPYGKANRINLKINNMRRPYCVAVMINYNDVIKAVSPRERPSLTLKISRNLSE